MAHSILRIALVALSMGVSAAAFARTAPANVPVPSPRGDVVRPANLGARYDAPRAAPAPKVEGQRAPTAPRSDNWMFRDATVNAG